MPGKMPNWTQKFGYGEFIHLEHRNCQACMMKGDKVFREVEDNCFLESARLSDMDATDVSIQVLSTIPVLFNYWAKPADGAETARFFNDHIAETVSKNPKRFIGIGTLPMQDIDLAIREMERCVNDLKMPGKDEATLDKYYLVGTDSEGQYMSFIGPDYEPLKYRLQVMTDDYFIIYVKWRHGATIYSRFERID